jgi:hypothetical protein
LRRNLRHDSGKPLVRLPAAGCHVPVARRPRMGQSASARNAGTFGKLVVRVHPAEGEKMTALSSMEYPHWLMIAGALLLTLGFVGLAVRQRSVEAEPSAMTSDDEPVETEADLTQEAYHRTAKEKRRDRWAERFGEEPLDAESKNEDLG